jgi:dCTP deaminase
MPFWSSEKLRFRLATDQLVVPYEESRVVHSAYELGVGAEAFITSNPGDITQLAHGRKILIPPGQFGLLVTREIVHVPTTAIAFISIRAGIKFQGLVNVSGFHVDPGYRGRLRFAVYNAGSRDIVLDQDQRVFMIWYADLDTKDDNPYPEKATLPFAISADDVSKIKGDVASPAELKKQLDELKVEHDKKFHEFALELDKKFHATEQTRLFNRSWIMLIIGITITIAVNLIIGYLKEGK